VNAVEAMRTSTAFTLLDHVSVVRVSGAGAFKAVDRLCPRELFLRDGQMLHTLLLREDARPAADLYVCADDEDFLLLAEGISADVLGELVRGAATAPVETTDLMASNGIVSLDGPYAWEVFAELAGREVIGQPYMTFFRNEELTAFRAGKTGEFGYYLMVPRERVAALRSTLLDRGGAYDIVEGDLAALDQCALENWYFNVRREGLADATPLELQLQWRISKKKTFTGSDALAARRDRVSQRLLLCAAVGEVAIGDRVMHRDTAIGTVVNAGHSPVRGDWVATALVDREYSHPGIRAYAINHGGTAIAIETLAAPALNNRSLFINPQLHSYHTRHEVQYPPVAPTRA
jgi:aminomethyltransferase